MEKLQLFIDLLFDHEETWVAGNLFSKVADRFIPDGANLITYNAMRGERLDTRAGLRTFLLEWDTGTVDEQLQHIKDNGIPVSSLVWSGNKSVHALIVLETPIPNIDAYRYLARWACTAAGADGANINPCRFTRIPECVNVETLSEQTLLFIGKRTPNAVFDAWLMKNHSKAPVAAAEPIVRKFDTPNLNGLKPWTKMLLNKGLRKGSRNRAMYEIAVDLWRNGFSKDQALVYLGQKRGILVQEDFSWKEIHTTVWSAYRRLEDTDD